MRVNKTQVKYLYGNNDKYDYFIIDKKSEALEIEIDKESLAYKIAGPGTYKISKYSQLPFGNFDYVLEIREKYTSNFKGLTLVHLVDLEQ